MIRFSDHIVSGFLELLILERIAWKVNHCRRIILLATGASNRAIAAELVVSVPTVKTHVSRILGKLNVQSRARAAAVARDLHLV